MISLAIVRKFKSLGFNNVLIRSHDELDLTNQTQVQKFFEAEKPDQVYLCAAKVGDVRFTVSSEDPTTIRKWFLA